MGYETNKEQSSEQHNEKRILTTGLETHSQPWFQPILCPLRVFRQFCYYSTVHTHKCIHIHFTHASYTINLRTMNIEHTICV